MKFVPSSKPKILRSDVIARLNREGMDTSPLSFPCIVVWRGYYKDTMGIVGKNDVGIFDDAIILLGRDVYLTFNGNADPSRLKKNVAVLARGSYRYKIGIHGLSKPIARRYKALVQSSKVTVNRHDGITETGYFGVNIHKAGLFNTSSLGCVTIYRPQWDNFLWSVENVMDREDAKEIVVHVLTE